MMIKIFSASQIKELDAYTIQHEPVASIELMERACRAFTNWFVEHYDATHRIGIICGTGNNGGDGLGIARMLHEWNYPVKVWVVKGTVKETIDFQINLQRMEGKISVIEISDPVEPEFFSDRTILIDAIFGSGLSRPVNGIYEEVIDCLNFMKAIKISVDIPSGLFADQHSSGEIFRAHHTVSFQLPKLAFLLPENSIYVGECHLVDIGLSKKGISEIQTDHYLTTLKSIKKLVKHRDKFDHKGKFGHGLLIAGSKGKMGACILSARASLRSGIGLLTTQVPRSGYSIIQVAVPEAMAWIDSSDDHFSEYKEENQFDVIAVGPGIGQHNETRMALATLFERNKKPMVIDADALNLLSVHSELQLMIPPGSILTPHTKEFERLVGSWSNDFDRLLKLKRFSKKIKSVVVLKGAYTSIACPSGSVYFNSTGNPGMATAGSGDVLTGILMSLLAQGYSAEEASLLGVYIHGLSGDLAVREKGISSLVSGDLVDFLPLAFKRLAGT
jgi:ADP-dependent NAD(P)H-hydrate dehydratase / NAD(P)H-hydrate epimerase